MDNKQMPDLSVIKGLLATAFGFILMLLAYNIILRIIYFFSGLLLVYYGLHTLNIPAINNFFNSVKAHLNKWLS